MFSLFVAGLILVIPTGIDGLSDGGVEMPSLIVPRAGLGLSPRPIVSAPLRLPAPKRPRAPEGLGLAVGLTAVVGAAVSLVRKKRDDEPFYVIVHGNGGSDDDFDMLLEKIGIPSDRVVGFDYSNGDPHVSSTEASKRVSTQDAAAALDALIRALAIDHSNIYSIHHSRGGAVGVSMIAALDDGRAAPIDGYVGAALLEPAIDGGLIGLLQRFGRFTTLLPDNGGFDPIMCIDGGCRDVRQNLGRRAGVEVIAVRNQDAIVTNFRDNPDGLRILDLTNDGGVSAVWWLPLSPLMAAWRITRAHASVLKHDAVANCISAEVALAGSCVWRNG